MFFIKKITRTTRKMAGKASYYILFIYLMVNSIYLKAQPVSTQDRLSLNNHLLILEDKNGALSINYITDSYSSQFLKSENIVPGGGMSRSVFWIKIHNVQSVVSPLLEDLILEVENPLADTVILYYAEESGIYSEKISGALVPFSIREIETANPTFLLSKKHFSYPVYIKIKSTTIINFPITIHNKESFYKSEKQSSVVYGIYFGIMALFFVYSLLGYIRTKSNLFLFFCLFVVNVLFLIMSIKGLGFVYLWPDNILINYYAPNFFTCFYVCMAMKFAMDILQVKKFAPAWHLPLLVTWYGTILVFVVSFFINRYPVTILNNSYVHILLLVFIFLSFLTWKRGNKAGLYFSLGWICFLGFTTPFLLKNFGKLSSNFFTDNGPFIGSVLEVLFFSFAAGIKVESLYVDKKQVELLLSKYESEVIQLKERIKLLLADDQSIGNKITINAATVEGIIDNPLSKREKEVLELIVEGYVNKEMANKLFVSENTIKKHICSIYTKLEVNNRAAVSKKAIEMGLLPPNA